MAHFAKINNENIVIEVIVAEQEFIDSGVVGDKNFWIQTSYNHNIRKNYAGIGYTYDIIRDVFIPPQPFASWLLDEDNCIWVAPTQKPDDTYAYLWDEDNIAWLKIEDKAEEI